MSEKTLKFDNIRINKKEFHKSKQPIDLMSVNVDQIAISDKFKHSDEGFKYFICYQEGEIVKPLNSNEWIHQIFWKRWQNMSFLIKDDEGWENTKKLRMWLK